MCAVWPAELQILHTRALFCGGGSDSAGSCTGVVAEVLVVLLGKGLDGLRQTMSLRAVLSYLVMEIPLPL